MQINIVIRTQFWAVHSWPGCPKHSRQDFLKHPHRHIFYVVMKWKVEGDDRDIEFLFAKEAMDTWIMHYWNGNDLGSMSCEQIAKVLIDQSQELVGSKAVFVSVSEDDENGAEVYA